MELESLKDDNADFVIKATVIRTRKKFSRMVIKYPRKSGRVERRQRDELGKRSLEKGT